MPPVVTIIGDATLDVHVAPAAAMRPGGDVPAHIRLEPGGQGANVAVRLARLGFDVRLVCAIADDTAGRMVLERLALDGVTVVGLAAEASGVIVVLLSADGERTMLSHRAPLRGGPDLRKLQEAEWLVVSGYVLADRVAGLGATGDTPRRVVLGCSLGTSEIAAWTDRANGLAPHLVVVNFDEAVTLTGAHDAPAALAARLGAGFGSLVVVTHDAGAVTVLDGSPIAVGLAPGNGPVIDTTGAGDAFAAALIADLAGVPWPPTAVALERGMASGTRLAAAVARVPGAQARVDGEPDAPAATLRS